jgi:DNA-binding CsgD family transcriptional regulator
MLQSRVMRGARRDEATSRPLLDREQEISTFEAQLHSLSDGGGLVVIEGPAGIGKTSLLEHVRGRAKEASVSILQARGGQLESDAPFGIVRQLFEPLLLDASHPAKVQLLKGAASVAGPLFQPEGPEATDPPRPGEDRLLATVHGLYWLTANLVRRSPHLIVIDDAHWADAASLRWIAYLAPRIRELPVLLVVAFRRGEPGGEDRDTLLSMLSADPFATVIQPGQLTQESVTTLAAEAFGTDPDPGFCEACLRVTAGNPLLLVHLIGALKADGIEPTDAAGARLREIAPDTVIRAVVVRLTSMPNAASRLARAVAIFEGGVDLRHAAALAGIDTEVAQDAADLLAAADILKDERPLDFVHPIIRQAIYSDLGTGVRARHHANAAHMLVADGEPPERAASHLLRAEPDGRAWAVDVLWAAGRRALQRGSPEAAVTYFQRALLEPPAPLERPGMLRDLGRAKVLARECDAADYLTRALEASDDPVERGRIADDLGRLLTMSGRALEAIERLEPMLSEFSESDPELAGRLAIDLGIAAWLAVPPRPEMVEQLAQRYWQVGTGNQDYSPLVANCAFAAYALGAPADVAAEHAEAALAGGGLLAEESSDSPAFQLALSVLTLTDRLELAGSLCDEALKDARARGSVSGVAAVSCWRSRNNLFRGKVAEAEADAQLSLAVACEPGGWELGLYVSMAFLIDALIERGDIDGAANLLADSGIGEELPECLTCQPLLHSRGRLRILQGQTEQGLADLFLCGEWQEAWPMKAPGMAPWRSTAAIALAADGDRDRARDLAADELASAREFGAPRAIAAALRAAGLVERGAKGIKLLREAVAILEGSPAELERARALTDLGLLLRVARERTKARDTLRAALDIAHRCGMVQIAEQAHEELVAAGARPRRAALSGVESLTPSELRVATLAAEGQTNSSIAQSLFVTLRTVEMHLSNAYGKLCITSRQELPVALGRSENGGTNH